MLAGHVHAVLVLVAADHARVGVRLLTHQRHLDLADVGLVRPYFEHRLLFYLEQIALLALEGESFPGPVGGAHILHVVLPHIIGNGGVEIAEVLVVGEVEEIVGLPADGDFGLLGDFDDGVVRWSFDDIEGEVAADESDQELVGPHLQDHVLGKERTTWVSCFFSSILMKVPVVLPMSFR